MKQKIIKALVFLLCVCSAYSFTVCSTSDNTSPSSGKSNSSSSSNEITATYTINADTSSLDSSYRMSDTLYGIFLEDINFAVDGGLYAELIKNRSFEYGTAAANANRHGWTNSNSDVLTFDITDGTANQTYLNVNNPTYATLTNTSATYEGISNVGYLEGLAVTAGKLYHVSLYMKSSSGYSDIVQIALENQDGTFYAQDTISGITNEWQKYELTLTPNTTINDDVLFSVKILSGSIDIDMVSLLPVTTYHGLNIREDIGEYLENLNPSFLRFPGGCVIEGKDKESMYSWKDSIGNGLSFTENGIETVGDVAVRPQGKSIWSGNQADPYYTTYGIGFYEYFELCEALDALPVPVLNAGMTCEVQSTTYMVYDLDSDEFHQCIQDALDLVEFCLGDETTYWGSIRIAMGHTEPFSLKYIAIGNEQWQCEYHEHYEAFVKSFDDAAAGNPKLYGNIELIVANGTSSESTEGWTYLNENPDDITALVDEHYYESPNWFLTNTTRYDEYDRNTQASVFLGEYAAQSNTLEAALAEAAYMTGLERNSDIVTMSCYAPLFGNSKSNQWSPDMMFFSNDSLYGSVNYYVQQIFSNNVGSTILPSSLNLAASDSSNDLTGYIGLGTWMTSAAYDNLTITSNDTDAVLYSTDFESDTILEDDNWDINTGEWSITDGRLIQSNTGDPDDANNGDSIYIGNTDWNNYTLTVDAEVLGGNEGFLIPVCVENTSNNIFWNIGGWGNTVSCLQIVSANSKSGQITGTVKNHTLKKNQVYHIKIVVDGSTIKCYIDDALYIDYTNATTSKLYETCSMDKNGDVIIKFVNVSDSNIDITSAITDIDWSSYNQTANVTTLAGSDLSTVNSFDNPTAITPTSSELKVSDTFNYTAPLYSVSIIRIPIK